jgi:hypothetical protein
MTDEKKTKGKKSLTAVRFNAYFFSMTLTILALGQKRFWN